MMYQTGPLDPVMDDLYTRLDAETRIVVQQRTSEIRTLMRRTAQDIVEIGQKLIEVKSALGHGLFSDWLRIEFEWSRGTAENFMAVALRFQNQKFSDFDLAPSALYVLASPSTPESARREALDRAAQGERVTHTLAKEIAASHRMTSATPQDEQVLGSRDLNAGALQSLGQKNTASPLQHSRSMTQAWGTTDPVEPTSDAAATVPVAANHKMAVHFSSRTVEHCTPETIVLPTLACLGKIDLDPCSEGGESPNVPAHAHYTFADDGLTHSWNGRIYMNPPYGREIGDWVEKLCSEHEAGRVTQAIALLPSRTDTQWWRRLRAYPVCFVQGRLTFVGSEDPAPFPSAVFYLGPDVAKFCRAFDHLGDVYRRIVIQGQQ
jgi:hypothetical protein